MEANQFWSVLDGALIKSGRKPLDKSGSKTERSIISAAGPHQVLRILAGPGSGKTEMLVWRVLYDLIICGTKAERILLTTFTRKAAEELTVRLSERAEAFVYCASKMGITVPDPKIHDVRIGTIHSLCDSMLSEFVDAYYQQDIRLLDELETELHLRKWWWQQVGGTQVRNLVGRTVLGSLISRALIRPNNWTDAQISLGSALAHHTETWLPRCSAPPGKLNALEAHHGASGLTADLKTLQQGWTTYLLDKPLALDFTQIQAQFLECQAMMLDQIDHVYVDEFQDTNPIQYAIHFGWLTTRGRDPDLPPMRLTVVGDDDQSIYRFRGSDVGCFMSLEGDCKKHKIPFRQEILQNNYRSSGNIVSFSQAYRNSAIPAKCSLKKVVTPVKPKGATVRLITGPWSDLCSLVAREAQTNGYRRGNKPKKEMATLLFSASEKAGRQGASAKPASDLRAALDAANIEVANPRNKIAGLTSSHVHTLTAVLSWFIDPLTRPINPASGKPKRCAAGFRDDSMAAMAPTVRPSWVPDEGHLRVQAQCWELYCGKNNLGPTVRSSDPEFNVVLDYLADLRDKLPKAWAKFDAGKAKKPRLTLAGLAARLISMPLFRNTGYSMELFRQAMFTELSETAIAASRSTGFSIDDPIEVRTDAAGKPDWDSRVWDFIGSLGLMVAGSSLNDPEVETLQQHAFPILTFHQSKGLEYDEIYLAATGRPVDSIPVILTRVFSGDPVNGLRVDSSGNLSYTDPDVDDWARADAAREIYVAMTRAKDRLTILHDPDHADRFMALDATIASLFAKLPERKTEDGLIIQEWKV
jgi:superfamily I DNA/RNA helicase